VKRHEHSYEHVTRRGIYQQFYLSTNSSFHDTAIQLSYNAICRVANVSSLRYKYLRLVKESSGELCRLAAADTCALDEVEDDLDDDLEQERGASF